MTISNLINFIDRHTNNGAIYPNEPWGEEVGVKEEGIAFVRSFSTGDWLALRNLNLKEKSNFWIECLIHLLDEAYTEEARQMIINIALTGTEENFFDAMECIRSFRRDVDIYTWLKLKNRASQISSSRLNNKSNNC
ncbi:hypothetical protein [Pleurocapsa sp. FMAR1]|uniref:hypothetical protein n=1 Tax=Pleurocapsa sp. FMAR1 TaxID=3040204 RepID=UPI0029C6A698|nr:hypothetical protein [Pleurocapsa sp. FMAR1]